ncbi:IPT/TIG domain-containing protein [Pontibacter sp. KCTC 32443]|uniref:DUF7619 domain-containing protein n=1 Tax=Pontibacter TaxID=323449 RepID=UPI00164DBD9B|nr:MULTISPECIES: IPT/TIG domain-containing protein [Pontibacter]MBC5774756.1 IPT/TIG domain-containing protein [Pontibacter sp. KCTC 32443]
MRTALLTFILILSFFSSFAQPSLYKSKSTIGDLPNLSVANMTMDKEGNVYVVDSSSVYKLKDGQILSKTTFNITDYAGKSANPSDVVVDNDLNIYLSDVFKSQILKYDKNGNLSKVIDIKDDTSNVKIFPFQILVDSESNLYAFDSYKRRLYVYNKSGDLTRKINILDVEPTYGTSDIILAFDKQENLHIAENKRIPYYGDVLTSLPVYFIQSKESELLRRFNKEVFDEAGNLVEPVDIVFDSSGNIYISDFASAVKVFSPDGRFLRRLSTYTTSLANSRRRYKLGIDSKDNLYLGSYSEFGSAINIYNQAFEQIGNWGGERRPQELAFDNQDNLYILDFNTYEIIKVDTQGKELLVFGGTESGITEPLAITVDDKNYTYVLNAKFKNSFILKFDPKGKLVAKIEGINLEVSKSDVYINNAGLAVDFWGNIYISTWVNQNTTFPLAKYDPQGKFIMSFASVGKEKGQLWNVQDVTVDAAGFVYTNDLNGRRIQKFSSTGKFIHQYGSFDTSETHWPMRSRLSSDAFGNIVLAYGNNRYDFAAQHSAKIYDIRGNLLQTLPNGTPSVAISRSGKYIAAADSRKDFITIYENTALPERNVISGKIYRKAANDCITEPQESGLEAIVIKAEPGPFYGISDAAGNYTITVEKGSYTIEPVVQNKIGMHINNICYSGPNPQGITFDNYGINSSGNDFGINVTLSPYLTTNVSSTRRRRCFESTTKVTYSNSGFAPANNAKVYVKLPKEVELLSADKTFTRLPNGTYVFEVGTVAAGETKTITIQDKVICGDESIRGLTVCTKAWMTHDGQTQPKGPVTTVTGKCDYNTGKVRVVLKNTGQADMETGEVFRVYLDGQLATVEEYKLAASDSLVLWIPANGKTIRVDAVQPDGNGENTLASTTVEACTTFATRMVFSAGFVNALPPDDEEPEVAEECLPIIDSFDPNDKQVVPTGLTEEKYTPTGAELKYKIRFQNTGTDVAYRVVVVDTLSEHLDLSTLQIGSASHAYRFDVSGKGKPVLTWTFDNIMLPDSNSNEPGSHGYIQFSIKPKTDLPEKTAVENFADIFFDYNSPVRTNLTVNRIYDMPPVIHETERLDPEQLIATPGIESFSPSAGKFSEEVTISGKKFSTEAAQNKVYFNGKLATVVAATETELKVLVPANATAGSIKVQTPDGVTQSITGFEVYQPPVLTSFSPAEGIAGTTVTIQGQHLTEQWLQSITLGNQPCEVINITGNSAVVKVPAGAVTGTFGVTSKGGEASSNSAFVVWHQPEISNLSKQLDKVGATITISGINFAPSAARNKVMFSGVVAQVLEATSTRLSVKVPEGAKSGIVTVETPGGTAVSTTLFEVIPAPIVTSFTPVAGTVGTDVELTGQHFLTLGEQDTILFNGEKAIVLEATPTTFIVRVPRGATSGKIKVAGAGGQAITAADFTIEELTPEQAIEVYPNPTTGNFTIGLVHADFEVQEVQLFSALGQIVYSGKINSPRPDKLDVKLTTPKSGIYILHIKTERGLIVKKLNIL